jgi:hypothetical protein
MLETPLEQRKKIPTVPPPVVSQKPIHAVNQGVPQNQAPMPASAPAITSLPRIKPSAPAESQVDIPTADRSAGSTWPEDAYSAQIAAALADLAEEKRKKEEAEATQKPQFSSSRTTSTPELIFRPNISLIRLNPINSQAHRLNGFPPKPKHCLLVQMHGRVRDSGWPSRCIRQPGRGGGVLPSPWPQVTPRGANAGRPGFRASSGYSKDRG